MPLGFITLLSGKGGRFDETKREPTFFSFSSVVIVLFRFGFS
jgi:hypothetical protein